MSLRRFLPWLCLRLCLRLCLPFSLMAQSAPPGSVASPALGFVYDAAALRLRPLLGIPAAASIGAVLDVGADLSAVAISPRQDYALVASSNQQSLAVVRLDRAPLKAIPIDGLDLGPDLMALSPAGSSAALYYAAANRIRIVAGLPGSPSISAAVDVSTLQGAVAAIAISDDGSSILAAANANGAGTVYLLTPGGNPSQAFAGGVISALAFMPNSQSAVIADSTNNQVYSLSGAVASVLAGPGDGISSPIALASSGGRIFVANAASQSIVMLDAGASHNQPVTVSCQCAPAGLYPLAGQAVFRLTEPSDAPISVFEGNRPDPRVVLIPAGTGSGTP